MATPMTATQVVTQLKKWGIRYVEIPGWATHNRNSVGAWGPVNGFIWHHTGADITTANAKTYASGMLYSGRSDLPGPLCQLSIGLDGTVFLVGWGRANHAGGGDPVVLQHVINEDYTGQLHPTKGNSNGVDGNAHFYGVEIQYSGSHAMAAIQYKTALRLSAAICDFHGWSEKSVVAHGEWSSDKWDPGYAPSKVMAMPAVRADVKATLTAGPTQEDDPMAGITTQDIYDAVWKKDQIAAPADAPDVKTNPTWQPQSFLKDTNVRVRGLEKQLTALAKTNAALVDTVAKLAAGIGDLDPAAIVTELKTAIESINIHLDVPEA
jgi:hypothetical protein